MTLEIVCKHSQRPRRATHFLQSAAYLLDLRRIRLGECAGVVESAARARQSALCAHQGCIQLGDRLLQVYADLLERHLVEFIDDILDAGLSRLQLPRSGR